MGTVRPTSNIDLLHGMIEGYFVTYTSSLIILRVTRGDSDYFCSRSLAEGINVVRHVPSSELGHANNPVDGSAHWATLRDVRIGKVSHPHRRCCLVLM
jgi:hypothetical protein